MDASSLYRHSISEYQYSALLVGQYGNLSYPEKSVQEESLNELYLLADTAYVEARDQLFIRLKNPDPGSFFPGRMVSYIKAKLQENECNLLICDAALKPGQLRNLEEKLEVRVIGRIELILDIFAMRAKTKSSALQVELAQLNYILPRLKGLGNVLSRLGGGIGTRGPGETMLETDRRHIRNRISKIKGELEALGRHRENTRKNRKDISFTLIGYTNAGKTSLLNAIGSSAVPLHAEDRLFATLDSQTRKVYLGQHNYIPLYSMVSDTIGFIRNLPAALVAAFSSTLEEISYSDVLILVMDASSPVVLEEYRVVMEEITRLGLENKDKIIFFNKDDLLREEIKNILSHEFPEALWGNTLSKGGTDGLRQAMFGYALRLKSDSTKKEAR